MITYIKNGDILSSSCEGIINTVNTQGIMGKGLALLYRQKYPEMFKVYRKACLNKEVKTGFMHVWKVSNQDKWIINFPTKQHWRNPSQLEWIIEGLQDLVKVVKENKIKSLGIPPLGCGLGGLHWYQVKKEIVQVCEQYLSDIKIEIYEP